jgi:hypothetical protein
MAPLESLIREPYLILEQEAMRLNPGSRKTWAVDRTAYRR